jgi:Flp pilus assembly protein TadD
MKLSSKLLRRRSYRRLATTLAFASAGLACAGAPPASLDDLSTDFRLEALPAKVQVTVNGQWMGFTPAVIHLSRDQSYQIVLSAPGFQSRAIGGAADALLRVRQTELVLVPDGLSGPTPQGNDVAALTAIAERLESLKDWNHATEFWRRVVTLAPRQARGHRGLGSAYAKLGQDELAIREYAQYLFLAPNAPDAERVQRAIDSYRGGINVPTVGADDQ